MKIADPSGSAPGSLAAKLGIKPHMKALLLNVPPEYPDWIGPLYQTLQQETSGPWEFVHVFVKTTNQLEKQLFELRDAIFPAGMIWVSWYKRSSPFSGDVSEDIIRDTAIVLGLVDIKVCSVTADWSALKLVIPRHRR